LGKLFLFEGGIRVPMIFRWPGVLEPGKTYSKPVSSLDIFPTVCAAAKIRLPKELKLDGLDLLPYLRNEKTATPHDMLFWSNGPNKAVRMGDWKLIIAGEHRFLFNLRDDVGEKKNVANQEPKVLKQLEDALHGWQDQMKPPAWPSKPERREVEIDGVPYEINI
jgi:arylsulfatase A-like enzyme